MKKPKTAVVLYPIVAGAALGAPGIAAAAAAAAPAPAPAPAAETVKTEVKIDDATVKAKVGTYLDSVNRGRLARGNAKGESARTPAQFASLTPRMQGKLALLTDRNARSLTALEQNNIYLDDVKTSVTLQGAKAVDATTVVAHVLELTSFSYRKVLGIEPDTWDISMAHDITLKQDAAGAWNVDDVVDYNDESPLAPALPAEAKPEREAPKTSPVLEAKPVALPGPVSDEERKASIIQSAVRLGIIKDPAGVKDVGAPYNYENMKAYVNAYWGPTGANWNSWYRNFGEGSTGALGGDCTNFISQIMAYGGWDYTDSRNETYNEYSAWWYKTDGEVFPPWGPKQTYSWAGAEMWRQFAYSFRTTALTSFSSLLVTDVLQLDYNSNGDTDHSMIVTKDNGGLNKFLGYHSTWDHNEHFKPLPDLLSSYPQPGATYWAHRT